MRAVVPLVALLVLAAAGCGRSAGTEIRRSAEYVALGDSYTSAPGMNPVVDQPCRRSGVNYPSLVDKALKIKSFADRSCAGARLADLEQPQTVRFARLNAPQLNVVGTQTRLVTIGMGLNDKAISTGLLLICIAPKAPEPSQVCQQYLEQPQSAVDAEVSAAAAELRAALATIAAKAPRARIVLVGYPRVAPDQGSCPDLLPVPAALMVRLRETLRFLDQAWSDVAKQAGAAYVDMYTASAGHDICSEQPWVSGYLGVPGKAAALHPLPAYQQAVADAVVATLNKP